MSKRKSASTSQRSENPYNIYEATITLSNQDFDKCPFTGLPAVHLKLMCSPITGLLTRLEKKLFFGQSKDFYAGILDKWILLYPSKSNDMKPSEHFYPKSVVEKVKGENQFVIVTNNDKRFHFQAPNSHEFSEWMVNINRIIEELQEGSKSSTQQQMLKRKLPSLPTDRKSKNDSEVYYSFGGTSKSINSNEERLYEEPCSASIKSDESTPPKLPVKKGKKGKDDEEKVKHSGYDTPKSTKVLNEEQQQLILEQKQSIFEPQEPISEQNQQIFKIQAHSKLQQAMLEQQSMFELKEPIFESQQSSSAQSKQIYKQQSTAEQQQLKFEPLQSISEQESTSEPHNPIFKQQQLISEQQEPISEQHQQTSKQQSSSGQQQSKCELKKPMFEQQQQQQQKSLQNQLKSEENNPTSKLQSLSEQQQTIFEPQQSISKQQQQLKSEQQQLKSKQQQSIFEPQPAADSQQTDYDVPRGVKVSEMTAILSSINLVSPEEKRKSTAMLKTPTRKSMETPDDNTATSATKSPVTRWFRKQIMRGKSKRFSQKEVVMEEEENEGEGEGVGSGKGSKVNMIINQLEKTGQLKALKKGLKSRKSLVYDNNEQCESVKIY